MNSMPEVVEAHGLEVRSGFAFKVVGSVLYHHCISIL